MRTRGGEAAFVSAVVADSLVLRHSVTWYSSMLGKKSTLKVSKHSSYSSSYSSSTSSSFLSLVFLLLASTVWRYQISFTFICSLYILNEIGIIACIGERGNHQRAVHSLHSGTHYALGRRLEPHRCGRGHDHRYRQGNHYYYYFTRYTRHILYVFYVHRYI